LAKTEKTFSNTSPSQVAIYVTHRSTAHTSVLEEVEGYKINFVFPQDS
jgi:hypothetical protein